MWDVSILLTIDDNAEASKLDPSLESFEKAWPQIYLYQWFSFDLAREFLYDRKILDNPAIPLKIKNVLVKTDLLFKEGNLHRDSLNLGDLSIVKIKGGNALYIHPIPKTSVSPGALYGDLRSNYLKSLLRLDFKGCSLELIVPGSCPHLFNKEDPGASGRAGAGGPLPHGGVACLLKASIHKKDFVPREEFIGFQREAVSRLHSRSDVDGEKRFIEESQLFLMTKDQRLVFVDLFNWVVWVKPPIANPLAVLRVPLDKTGVHPLTDDQLMSLLRSFVATEPENDHSLIWAPSKDGRQHLGFVTIVSGEGSPVGAKLIDDGRAPLETSKLKGRSEEGLTAAARSLANTHLPSPLPQIPASHWVRRHLSTMVAYPSFLSSEALPPQLPVFRIDNLFYTASKLDEAKRCGTFFFRIPTSDLFLPIVKSKTIVYNDKSPAALDILFKDWVAGPMRGKINSGVRFIMPYLEAYWAGKHNQVRDDPPRPPDHLVKGFFQKHFGPGSRLTRSKLKDPPQDDWKWIVKWVSHSFTTALVLRFSSRLLYLKPPPLTLYFFYSKKQDKWVSQRGVYHPEISALLEKYLTPTIFGVAAIHHPSVRLSPVDLDHLKWASYKEGDERVFTETFTGSDARRVDHKVFDPVVLPYDKFDRLVEADCTSEKTIDFLKKQDLQGDYFERLAKSSLPRMIDDKTDLHKGMDLVFCYLCEVLGIEMVVMTTPFHWEEAAFTEIMDVRPRDYKRLVWTGKKEVLSKLRKRRRRIGDTSLNKELENALKEKNPVKLRELIVEGGASMEWLSARLWDEVREDNVDAIETIDKAGLFDGPVEFYDDSSGSNIWFDIIRESQVCWASRILNYIGRHRKRILKTMSPKNLKSLKNFSQETEIPQIKRLLDIIQHP